MAIRDPAIDRRPGNWQGIWAIWAVRYPTRPPVISSIDALESAPYGMPHIVLRPDIDLRMDDRGLWNHLEGMAEGRRRAALGAYITKVGNVAASLAVGRMEISTSRLPPRLRHDLVEASTGTSVLMIEDTESYKPLTSVLVPEGVERETPLPTWAEATALARDTLKFFGHQPAVRHTGMPSPVARRTWWDVLPEYARFHAEASTRAEAGEFDWLEVRPELVISAMLKSLVQPGFEMVPRVMGFPGRPPLHVKWIRCRYHFRADAFAQVWEAIVDATWDEAYMADLLNRVRASYDRLAEVLVLFPETDAGFQALTGKEIVALVTSWWPRWIELFALSWFIQAQGDDILYPFIDRVVANNLLLVEDTNSNLSWPRVTDLLAPTTPVLSGDYMGAVGVLRQTLLASDLTSVEEAMAALEGDDNPNLAALVAEHLSNWHWMRDRDLLFQPWDTAHRVIETALRTEPHKPPQYAENRKRNLTALSMHADLAEDSGLAVLLNHAVRFFHDMSVERENHHVLWLKYSYPLRRLFLEVERRLVATGSIDPGDIWFMQVPELLFVVGDLSRPLDHALVDRVKNRRRGFEFEAKLTSPQSPPTVFEDDYF